MAPILSYRPISMCSSRSGIIISYSLSHRCPTGLSFGSNPLLVLYIPNQSHCRCIWRWHTTYMHARQSLLSDCLSALHSWFCHNGLALNSSKSESILIGTRQRLCTFPPVVSPTIAGISIPFSETIKTLGVTLDQNDLK